MLSHKKSLNILKKTDALLEGHFILSSGLHSTKYIQCAKLLSFPDIAKNILSGQAFDHDVKNKYAQVVRNSSWSKSNRYDRFSVLTGVNPVYENIVTSET